MKEENELYIASSVASSRSMQTSLEAIRLGDAGLTERRMNLLNRVWSEGNRSGKKYNNIMVYRTAGGVLCG